MKFIRGGACRVSALSLHVTGRLQRRGSTLKRAHRDVYGAHGGLMRLR